VTAATMGAAARRLRSFHEDPSVIARWQAWTGPLLTRLTPPRRRALLALAAATGGVTDATLMLQREVADRLTAGPDTREYGVLSIQAALHADVTRVLALPPGAFRPPPKVSSAVVRLVFRPPRVAVRDEALLVAMVRSIFTQRRKTLNNALKPFAEARGRKAAEALTTAGLDGQRRPETLQLIELARLADVFASTTPPPVL